MIEILTGQTQFHLCSWKDDIQVHRMARHPFFKLQQEARKEGIDLQILSGFRSFETQLSIWNRKATGQKKVLSVDNIPLDIQKMSEKELTFAILNWSALPGLSRHHWGTDLDIYDASIGLAPEDIQLVPSEYSAGGPFAKLGNWLNRILQTPQAQGFFRPYQQYLGGVQVEPWHISWNPLAQHYTNALKTLDASKALDTSHISLWPTIEKHLKHIIQQYALSISKPLYPSPQLLHQNSLSSISQCYGHSVRKIPLEVYLPSGPVKTLVIASIHGNESEGTHLLSQALRLLKQQGKKLKKCAVILNSNPDGSLLGTRANANGVDLNRNFPSANWSASKSLSRLTLEAPRILEHSSGFAPNSEPETNALIDLIHRLQPQQILSIHSPLGCVDDPNKTPLGIWLSEASGLELITDIGYPTPGSMGTWCEEQKIPIITLELPRLANEEIFQLYTPILIDVLHGDLPHGS